ncbi:MAG: Na+/H+ antiporter NhaA, partial [Anaerolineae bacterium]|nr:Na+/H+ antiporter NhaA [Anaerolineae bacterium]
MVTPPARRPRLPGALRAFLDSETAGGNILMAVAALALIVANSAAGPAYFATLETKVFGLTVLHWINDALMAVFFLLVGLEIKREFIDGELSTWEQRSLPAIAAVGGMAAPALVYVAINAGTPESLSGWAIPAATDIAFALGILALAGKRVPMSLKVFLTALAIMDDLGAVIIVALFYTAELQLWALGGVAAVTALLIGLNRIGVKALAPYMILGVGLWILMHESGVHATLAGVVLALTIPIAGGGHSPLHKLEHALHKPVALLVVPVFGFANAGVSLTGLSMETLAHPVTLGIAAGLFAGKQIGIFGFAFAAVKMGLAQLPRAATWPQM